MFDNEVLLYIAIYLLFIVQIIIGVKVLLLSQKIKSITRKIETNIHGELNTEVRTKVKDTGPTTELNPAEINLFAGKGNIQESLASLCEKYYLVSMTLASADGLVIASSHNNPEEEAARYSYHYNSGNDPEDSSVNLFGMDFRGENIVGIIKKKDAVPEEWNNDIKRDTYSLLSYWLHD